MKGRGGEWRYCLFGILVLVWFCFVCRGSWLWPLSEGLRRRWNGYCRNWKACHALLGSIDCADWRGAVGVRVGEDIKLLCPAVPMALLLSPSPHLTSFIRPLSTSLNSLRQFDHQLQIVHSIKAKKEKWQSSLPSSKCSP